VARILVVDDETDLTATYERLLRRRGHGVVAAASRGAGLAAIDALPLDLVIADLRLPDGDGLDLVRAARSVATPVIVITGLASEVSRRESLAAGASAYLSKPFSAAAFAALVDETLSAARGPGSQPERRR
jgi:two-component system OmpR family response regulator